MKYWLFCFITIAWVAISCKQIKQEKSPPDHIEVLDSSLLDIFSWENAPDTLGSGYVWSEGPVYVTESNMLLFSDVPTNRIYKWTEAMGVEVYLEPSGYTGEDSHGEEGSNGLIIDNQGRLLICQHGDRRVAVMNASLHEPSSQFTTLADNFSNKKFNSPNDLCQSTSGHIYFTDPPYGLSKNAKKELDFHGVYRIDTSGVVSLLIDSLSRPNGIALSTDEKTLYITNSDPEKAYLYAYKLDDSNGVVSDGKVLLDMTSRVKNHKGLPDGLKIHHTGHIFTTGPGGVLIVNPDGKHLGTIKTSKATSNCAFGSEDKEIFLTNHDLLVRVRL